MTIKESDTKHKATSYTMKAFVTIVLRCIVLLLQS